ncbi:MAG: Wzt carbohydrate-binding domain-containing protein, partial [Christensenellaceae bacterium]
DQYKKLIAGLDIRKEKKYNNEVADGSLKQKAKLEADMANGDWKQHYSLNQSALEYGEKELEIVDFGIFDEDNQLVLSCSKGKTYTICMKVKANVEVIEPIFAFSVKDIKGLEISGTNTFLEKVDTGILHVGDTVVTSFTQKIELQGTQFFISFGCTKFMQDGTLKVFHRLYDVIELSVMAAKTSVGWFDMNTQIKVQKEEANT